MGRVAEIFVQPGKRLEMRNVVVVFLQSYPGLWFLDYFITVDGTKKGEQGALPGQKGASYLLLETKQSYL